MRWIAVSLAAVALSGVTLAQAAPPDDLPAVMRPKNVVSPIRQFSDPVTGRVVGRAFNYFVVSETPRLFLVSDMTRLLHRLRFGELERPVTMRLLDGEGRLVWAAGRNGSKTWVRVRPRLAGCKVLMWDGRKSRRLGRAAPKPCPVRQPPRVRDHPVLRPR